MKKIAIVDIKGGLGNQLFQTAYALYLKSKNINTYCDISFYETNMKFPRNLEFDLDKFGLKTVKLKNNRIFFLMDSFFEESNSFNENEFKFINRFVGYYQDFYYLEKSKNQLRQTLDMKSSQNNKDIVAIHVRKGDYSTINQELSNSYYTKALETLKIKKKNFSLDIFTDDNDFVPDSNIFKNINNIYYPEQHSHAKDDFLKMCDYQYYIIANSSFSALAAYLSEHENKVIIYPKPWWRNSKIKLENIPKSWISVENHSI